ncbi:MAG TPA: TonB-dependent receptor [Candidatus Avibacteroides excrementipullorum]|nr:TonB-dependent receptor [Candidatus Avibacteroides excrementipullorum]
MKKLLLTVILSYISILIYAASPAPIDIKGKITDATTKDIIEFVNISIYDNNGNLVKGAITDLDGNYIIQDVGKGSYTMKVSYVGYRTVEKKINVDGNKNMTLNLSMREDTELLDEVEIVAEKPQMIFDIDKRIFNADHDLTSLGGSASDLLSNIPSIEVDSEGTVSLRGDEGVTIWINGKDSGLTSDNQSQILEQLPAETIDRVEVITNPSSKYSSEGSAGIINIILKKNINIGYYGGVQARATTAGMYNASGNINYSKGKWDMFLNVGYRHHNGKSEGYDNRTMNDGTYLNQTSEGKRKGDNMFTRLGVTFHPTFKDDISLNGFGMFGGGSNNRTINYLSNMPGTYQSAVRKTLGNDDMNGGNISMDYMHRFSEKSYLSASASYNVWGMDGSTDYLQDSQYADRTESSIQKQSSHMNNNGWEFTADYSNQITENHKIETGYKGELRSEHSPIETMSGTSYGNLVPQNNLYNDFRYDSDIHALYVSYSGKINNFGIQAGLRGEYTLTDAVTKYKNTDGEIMFDTYKTDYLDLFPSLFLSYSLPNNNEIQVNYTRRLRRPRGHMLNSFRNITDSTNISYGNPSLSPQYSNVFEVNYIKTWGLHTLTASAYYRGADNVFERITYMDENEIMNTTWFNVTESKSIGVELVAKNKLFNNILDLTTTVNLYYFKLDGFEFYDSRTGNLLATGDSEENFSWDARMIANVKLPYDINLQVTGRYRSKRTVAQGYRKPSYSLDAGLRKSFLDNRLSVAVNARDLLDSRKRQSITIGDDFRQESSNSFIGRNIGITISYSFGNLKEMLKKQANRPQNSNSANEEDDYFME